MEKIRHKLTDINQEAINYASFSRSIIMKEKKKEPMIPRKLRTSNEDWIRRKEFLLLHLKKKEETHKPYTKWKEKTNGIERKATDLLRSGATPPLSKTFDSGSSWSRRLRALPSFHEQGGSDTVPPEPDTRSAHPWWTGVPNRTENQV